jgi:hypothetical protein
MWIHCKFGWELVFDAIKLADTYLPGQCLAPTSECCGGTCTNLQTDASNCGACGNAVSHFSIPFCFILAPWIQYMDITSPIMH